MDTNIIIQETVRTLFIDMWPLWAFGLFIIAIELFFYWLEGSLDRFSLRKKFKKGKLWRSDRQLILWLQKMKPPEFERYVTELFSRLGYKAEHVGKSHDGGIDVVLRKDGVTHYVQCKKFITSKVSVGDVRDFYGALADHFADGTGYFITTNVFTAEAELFAKDKPIELIDGNKLISYIRMAEKKEQKNKTNNTTVAGNLCPKCGGTLVRRVGKYGDFWGCSEYPRCDYTADI